MTQTDFKIGDTVEVVSGLNPPLQFVIQSFDRLGTDTLACGEYGCINVDLLIKVEAVKS